MIYKFCIVSDEVENFKLEIAIDADDTFMRLRNSILEAVGFSKDEMSSFFICDEDWTKEKEVTLTDMDTDSDQDIWLMEDTPISELVEDEGQKLIFTFDYMSDRSFFMEMKESTPGKGLKDPLCQRKVGKAPEQFKSLDDFTIPVVDTATPGLDDFDGGDDLYGSAAYNEDEFDRDGFTDVEELPED